MLDTGFPCILHKMQVYPPSNDPEWTLDVFLGFGIRLGLGLGFGLGLGLGLGFGQGSVSVWVLVLGGAATTEHIPGRKSPTKDYKIGVSTDAPPWTRSRERRPLLRVDKTPRP